MIGLAGAFLALAVAGGHPPEWSKCDLLGDALAWGDAHVYLKRYPGSRPPIALFVAISVSRSKPIELSFAPRLRYRDGNRRDAVVDLVVKRNAPATWPPDVEDFVMSAYDITRVPRSVTIRCGKDVLSRTTRLRYGG